MKSFESSKTNVLSSDNIAGFLKTSSSVDIFLGESCCKVVKLNKKTKHSLITQLKQKLFVKWLNYIV